MWIRRKAFNAYLTNHEDVGESLGAWRTWLEISRAREMGELDLWFAFHKPKTSEEWEAWEAEHGKNFDERWK